MSCCSSLLDLGGPAFGSTSADQQPGVHIGFHVRFLLSVPCVWGYRLPGLPSSNDREAINCDQRWWTPDLRVQQDSDPQAEDSALFSQSTAIPKSRPHMSSGADEAGEGVTRSG